MKIQRKIFPSRENVYPPEYIHQLDEHLRPAFQALGGLLISNKDMDKYVLMKIRSGMSSTEEKIQMRSILNLRFGDLALAIYKTHVQASAFCYTYYQDKSGVYSPRHANWREILEFVYNVLIVACDGDVELLQAVREPYATLHLLAQFCAEEQMLAIVTGEMIKSPGGLQPVLDSEFACAPKVEIISDAVNDLHLSKATTSAPSPPTFKPGQPSSDFPRTLSTWNKRRILFIQFRQLPANTASLDTALSVNGVIPKHVVLGNTVLAMYAQETQANVFIEEHPSHTTVFEVVKKVEDREFKSLVNKIDNGMGKRFYYDKDEEEIVESQQNKYLKAGDSSRVAPVTVMDTSLGDASAVVV